MAMKVTYKRDPLFEEVKKYVQQQKMASCSMIQRRFRLGFNRAEQILRKILKWRLSGNKYNKCGVKCG